MPRLYRPVRFLGEHGTDQCIKAKLYDCFRVTVTLQPNEDMPEPIVAYGDAPARKDAEKLAALNALYQLDTRELVCILDMSLSFLCL